MFSTRVTTTALAATSDSMSYSGTIASPIATLFWSIRAKERSSTARLFHRLAYTPRTAQPTDLGLTLRLTSPSSSSSSIRQGRSGRSCLSVSAAKLSCSPAPSKLGTSSAFALDRTLIFSTPGSTSSSLARIRSRAPSGKVPAMNAACTAATFSARCLGDSSPPCSASIRSASLARRSVFGG